MSDQPPPAWVTAPGSPGRPGRSASRGRPAVTVMSWISAVCLVVGSALPLVGGGGGSPSLFSGGDSRFNVFILLIAALLAVGGSVAAGRSSAAGLAGGAGLIGATLFGVLVSFIVSALKESDGAPVGAGTVLLGIGAVASLVTFLVALAAPARREVRSPTLNGIAIPGALASVACSVGLLLPAPDEFVSFKDRLNLGNPLVNVLLVAWLCTLGIAGLIGFLSRRRWGILLALGAYIPMAWFGFSLIADLATNSRGSLGSQGIGQVFSEDLHPVFGIGLIAMGICLLVGLFGGGSASRPEVASSPGAWAADPFGRHQFRYWDGRHWTEHVSNGGQMGVDPAQWNQPTQPTASQPTQPTASQPQWAAPISPVPKLGIDDSDATVVKPSARQDRAVIVFDDGRRYSVSGLTLIGRDPEPSPSDPPDTALVRFDDPERSVSKTHLAIGFTAGSLWVSDRGSSNGSAVVAADGTAVDLPPHERTNVGVGVALRLGDRTLRIIQES